MPREMKDLTLNTLAGGAAEELFQRELSAVLENVADKNTDLKARKVTLEVTLTPREDSDGARRNMDVTVQAKSKPRPVKPANSYAFLSRKDGEIRATTNDIRQGDLLEDDEEVDGGTGEVISMKDRKTGA